MRGEMITEARPHPYISGMCAAAAAVLSSQALVCVNLSVCGYVVNSYEVLRDQEPVMNHRLHNPPPRLWEQSQRGRNICNPTSLLLSLHLISEGTLTFTPPLVPLSHLGSRDAPLFQEGGRASGRRSKFIIRALAGL
ncbi:unnamed protein product [Pleuronectes platessa]|uniref:Uncharacterized protein n=1 Tax=Pleuronectes platessa TaxID=8262 RepID=A0A9N7VLW2_PLEPL|nr:unnamed protein product [Pleuronectes platessa]